MLRIPDSKQTEMELVVLEDLIPEKHLLRKIEKYIDFTFVREKLSPFYCKDNGRPAFDPVMLFKIYLLGLWYTIRSSTHTRNTGKFSLSLVSRTKNN